MREPAVQMYMRSRLRVPLPTVDPRATDADRWFPASGFELVRGPSLEDGVSAQFEAVIVRAAAITKEAHGAAEGGDERSKVRAAGLHALAAGLRREAGAWAACIENFTAMISHCLAIGDAAAAEAYVQKLRFVSDYALDDATKAAAALTAMSAYIELCKPESALGMGGRARALSEDFSDDDFSKKLADLTAKGEALRLTNGGDWESRKGRIPDEFRVRAMLMEPIDIPPVGEPWLSDTRAGIELLMDQPGVGGECRYWVTHRVTHGTHRICTLPNWSGRAMGAAKAMLKVSKADKNGTDGPSSAILQVTSALEAFINAVVHFIRQSQNESWDKIDLPKYCQPDEVASRTGVPTCDQWKEIGRVLFGAGWIEEKHLCDMKILFQVRDCLVHYNWEHEESLYQKKPHWLIGEFKSRKVELRPEPAPWIDRLLTPGMASWAINLGEMMISKFRRAWAAELVKGEFLSRWDAVDDNAAAAEADAAVEAAHDETEDDRHMPVVAPSLSNGTDRGQASGRIEAGGGLRNIPVRRPNASYAGQHQTPV